MGKRIFKLSLIFWLLALAACVQIKDKEKDHDPVVSVDHYVEETSTLNQYFVHLSPLDSAEVYRQEVGQRNAKALAVPLVTAAGDWVDSHVDAGKTYRYQYVDKFGNTMKTIEVAIPLDILIDRAVDLSEAPQWSHVNRIYFTKSGVLTTNGHDVTLHAQVIESDFGVIRTFPADQTAKEGIPGRAGGHIHIYSNEAHGNLSVELRGENGSAGRPPILFQRDGSDGSSGGDSGHMILDVSGLNDLKTSLSVNHQGVGGEGSKGAPAGSTPGICLGGQCGGGRPYPVGAGRDGIDGVSGDLGELCFAQAGKTLSCQQ